MHNVAAKPRRKAATEPDLALGAWAGIDSGSPGAFVD
jgi:hypothetical protein